MISIIHFTCLLYAIRILRIPVTVDTQFLFNNDYCLLNSALSPKQDGFCQNGRYTLFTHRIMKNGRGNAWGRGNGSLDSNSTHADSASLHSPFSISRSTEEKSHSSFTTTKPSHITLPFIALMWRTKSSALLLFMLMEGRNAFCNTPTTPSFNSNRRNISSSSLHNQIRKRIHPDRHSSSILIHTTPFFSIGIHQRILIKFNIQQHPSPRLQTTTPSPHSIHSYQYSPLLIEFKSIHFTLHLWQSHTTSSLPCLTIPINYIHHANTPRITKQPFIQESPNLILTTQYSIPISCNSHCPSLHFFSDSSSLINETITMGWEVVKNTLNNAIDVLYTRSAREESGLSIPPFIHVERRVPSLRVFLWILTITQAFHTRHCAKASVIRISNLIVSPLM